MGSLNFRLGREGVQLTVELHFRRLLLCRPNRKDSIRRRLSCSTVYICIRWFWRWICAKTLFVTPTFSPLSETISSGPYINLAEMVWSWPSRVTRSLARWLALRFCKYNKIEEKFNTLLLPTRNVFVLTVWVGELSHNLENHKNVFTTTATTKKVSKFVNKNFLMWNHFRLSLATHDE